MTDPTPETGCCARFDPASWDGKELTWENKLFAKDRIRSFLHIPLNFGKVVMRLAKKIEDVNAMEKPDLWLNDENSLWGSDLIIAVTQEVPGAEMVALSGTFMAKVFEGPYKNAGKWAKDMQEYVQSKGREVMKIYFFYTTCPKCSKVFGENYVVLFAQV